MGFPPPSAEELEENHRQLAESDGKIGALELEICRLKQEATKPLPLAFLLPRPVEEWLQRILTPRAVVETIRNAQVEHDWIVYDRTCRRRPVYPRKRALSLTRKSRGGSQQRSTQSQSQLFSRLSANIRTMIYREVLGGLTIEIQAFVAGTGGPKGSENRTVFNGSRIEDSAGRYWHSPGYGGFPSGKQYGFRPWILPLLQSCRRIYTEAIHVLYTQNVFRCTKHSDMIFFPKYLLTQRLQSIRYFRCTLQLGYPWHVQRLPLQALARLRWLQRLHIEGKGPILVDSKSLDLIDLALWQERKHHIIPFVSKLNFVKEVDLYLPILEAHLGKDVKAGRCRVHGIALLPKTKENASSASSLVLAL